MSFQTIRLGSMFDSLPSVPLPAPVARMATALDHTPTQQVQTQIASAPLQYRGPMTSQTAVQAVRADGTVGPVGLTTTQPTSQPGIPQAFVLALSAVIYASIASIRVTNAWSGDELAQKVQAVVTFLRLLRPQANGNIDQHAVAEVLSGLTENADARGWITSNIDQHMGLSPYTTGKTIDSILNDIASGVYDGTAAPPPASRSIPTFGFHPGGLTQTSADPASQIPNPADASAAAAQDAGFPSVSTLVPADQVPPLPGSSDHTAAPHPGDTTPGHWVGGLAVAGALALLAFGIGYAVSR